jgi:hypothetical protein
VLATVLREGITNLLRHSKAQHCAIEAVVVDGKARLTIVNDGVGAQPEKGPKTREGTGIQNLVQRVELLGGSLQAGVRQDGWFRLVAWVPLTSADDSGGERADNGGEKVKAATGVTAQRAASGGAAPHHTAPHHTAPHHTTPGHVSGGTGSGKARSGGTVSDGTGPPDTVSSNTVSTSTVSAKSMDEAEDERADDTAA